MSLGTSIVFDSLPSGMRIDLLIDYPQYITTLAPALLDHWRFALREDTLDIRTVKLHCHLNRQSLPLAWVAHGNGQVYGTAALRASDIEGREDLTPWLGGVFVLTACRHRGIARALCEAVEKRAAHAGVDTLISSPWINRRCTRSLAGRPLIGLSGAGSTVTSWPSG